MTSPFEALIPGTPRSKATKELSEQLGQYPEVTDVITEHGRLFFLLDLICEKASDGIADTNGGHVHVPQELIERARKLIAELELP